MEGERTVDKIDTLPNYCVEVPIRRRVEPTKSPIPRRGGLKNRPRRELVRERSARVLGIFLGIEIHAALRVCRDAPREVRSAEEIDSCHYHAASSRTRSLIVSRITVHRGAGGASGCKGRASSLDAVSELYSNLGRAKAVRLAIRDAQGHLGSRRPDCHGSGGRGVK